MSQLSVEIREHGAHMVVAVVGEVDYYTCPQLRRGLDAAAATRPNLVLDLTGMTFMDSAGLGEIVRSYKQVTGRAGRLAVVCTSRIVLRLFRVTGIDTVIDVFGSVEAASARD
jgi:anti-sigma B factor antagonist